MRNKKGFLLITTYLVVIVLLILGSAFLLRSVNENKLIQREIMRKQAFYLAEAGLDRGLARMREGHNSGSFSQCFSFGCYNCSWDETAPGSNRWRITSIGAVGGISRTVQMEVIPDSYARYLYFTNSEYFRWMWWNIPVWFITGDFLGGPLQTNGHLNISGAPVFGGIVKTADDYIKYMHGGPPDDNPDFQQGIQLGANPVPMPSKALDLRTAAVQGGLHLTGPTTITLKDDGTMDVTNSHEGWVDNNMPLPANRALFITGGDLTVSGTLNGSLTMGTDRDIVIADNTVYHDDPRVNSDSQDSLGLIAERDVLVSKDAPYNVEVNASVMALGDSFQVERWWVGPAKGTLTVYGGIIQKNRGPVGTFNPATNQRVSGYSKDYQHDSRLGENPPPYYPTTGDYVKAAESWEEQ